MENKGYLIYEVGILEGNDNGEIKFILFLMFFLSMTIVKTKVNILHILIMKGENYEYRRF